MGSFIVAVCLPGCGVVLEVVVCTALARAFLMKLHPQVVHRGRRGPDRRGGQALHYLRTALQRVPGRLLVIREWMLES